MLTRTALLCAFIGLAGWGVQASAATKVGYLDVTRVAEESPQYAAARKALQRELDRRKDDLEAQAKQIDKLKEKYEKDAKILSDAEVNRLQQDILARQRKLKNQTEDYRDQLSMRQNEEQSKLLRQVAEVVKAIGKEQGYDLILTQGVAYHSKSVDISDEVLSRLKKNFSGH